jgi:DNA polymerase-4
LIAHFDVDAFYAAVAELDDPSLCGAPLAVAGSGRRAVVLTASYAARPFGVRSAMPLWQARERCPDLIVVAPNFARYRELSGRIFAVLRDGSSAVEGLSLDEAFVDLPQHSFEDAVAFARGVRLRVKEDIGLTVSAGVAAVKIVAKIASDACKPDGLAAIEPGREAEYLRPFPAGRLWGIGPKTQARLSEEGIVTIGRLAELGDADLSRLFGRAGHALRELARGNDGRGVNAERETRSISSEETFEFDVRDEPVLRRTLNEQAHEVAGRLRDAGLRASTIGIKLKLADFRVVNRQTRLAQPADDARILFAAARHCLTRAALAGAPVRLIGLRAGDLAAERVRQESLFSR